MSLRCKAPWHPCMGWVLGSSNCSYNWLAARGRLFKSACSTRARSLFGNFCRGVLKELGKRCKAVWGFFPFLFLFVTPLLGLHPSPDFTQNLRVSKRWWQNRRKEVLGSRFGEVWVFALFFFSSPLISTSSRSSWQPPTPLTCSAAAAQLAAEAERSGGAF